MNNSSSNLGIPSEPLSETLPRLFRHSSHHCHSVPPTSTLSTHRLLLTLINPQGRQVRLPHSITLPVSCQPRTHRRPILCRHTSPNHPRSRLTRGPNWEQAQQPYTMNITRTEHQRALYLHKPRVGLIPQKPLGPRRWRDFQGTLMLILKINSHYSTQSLLSHQRSQNHHLWNIWTL